MIVQSMRVELIEDEINGNIVTVAVTHDGVTQRRVLDLDIDNPFARITEVTNNGLQQLLNNYSRRKKERKEHERRK